MEEGTDGRPKVGPTARTLGVRPGHDLPVVDGMVGPGTGGMSVAPDSPMNLPPHRRPPRFGGTGKDQVWGIDIESLDGDVQFRQDKPAHGVIEPAKDMTIERFQDALAALAPRWFKP